MKKILFIDRDGTIVIEPSIDYRIDSLEKLEFYPAVFQNLAKIANELDYELVMVTNQAGLGTDTFPEEKFYPVHNKIIKAFENEKIIFSDIIIDSTFPHKNAPTRKHAKDLLQKYIHGNYNLQASYVIGDHESDMQLAKNLNCKGIFIGEKSELAELSTTNWAEIYQFLKQKPRKAQVTRKTFETDIFVDINLDGNGKNEIKTGVGFFDHMLEQIAKHGDFDLFINVKGDIHIDEHHTIEDTAIALGEAFAKALGSKRGIARYGFLLPMDESLARFAIDFGGRPYLVWKADFKREKIGDFPTELFSHFFKSFSDASKSNLNVWAEGENEHHKIEGIFKAFARACKMAVAKTSSYSIPSTKGIL